MYNIAICEDEPIFLHTLKSIVESRLKNLNTDYILDCFEEGESLIAEVVNSNIKYDAIFFDIDLPNISGIEVAEKIRKIDESVLFVFITSFSDKVYEVFELDTFNFIRKNYFEEEIEPVLEALIQRLDRDCEVYEFKTKDGGVKLRLNEISHFRRHNKNIEIYTKQDTYITTHHNIKDLELELNDKGFFEIYRGTLVNLSYVKYIKDDILMLTTGSRLPISRRRLSEFKKLFFDNLHKGVI